MIQTTLAEILKLVGSGTTLDFKALGHSSFKAPFHSQAGTVVKWCENSLVVEVREVYEDDGITIRPVGLSEILGYLNNSLSERLAMGKVLGLTESELIAKYRGVPLVHWSFEELSEFRELYIYGQPHHADNPDKCMEKLRASEAINNSK